jgi:hypothetical protein
MTLEIAKRAHLATPVVGTLSFGGRIVVSYGYTKRNGGTWLTATPLTCPCVGMRDEPWDAAP